MELSEYNVGHWLEQHSISTAGASFRSLGGGVSNHVILAELPAAPQTPRLVIKQSLARLRVEEEWLSERDRIFREAAAMRWLAGKLEGGRVPAIIVEDREHFAIAMEAAPAAADMWKSRLFAQVLALDDARAAGTLLGSMIAVSHNNAEAQTLFGDQTVFDQLRIDPYYRTTAARHPSRAHYFETLMQRSAARRFSLTHGDWSPKNLLTDGTEMWVIDWEVIHYGDPAFDIAFLLNHLLLKSLAMPVLQSALHNLARTFLEALKTALSPEAGWLEQAAAEHLPALLLARVDGKSPAEYLDAEMKQTARQTALRAMDLRVQHPLEIFEL